MPDTTKRCECGHFDHWHALGKWCLFRGCDCQQWSPASPDTHAWPIRRGMLTGSHCKVCGVAYGSIAARQPCSNAPAASPVPVGTTAPTCDWCGAGEAHPCHGTQKIGSSRMWSYHEFAPPAPTSETADDCDECQERRELVDGLCRDCREVIRSLNDSRTVQPPMSETADSLPMLAERALEAAYHFGEESARREATGVVFHRAMATFENARAALMDACRAASPAPAATINSTPMSSPLTSALSPAATPPADDFVLWKDGQGRYPAIATNDAAPAPAATPPTLHDEGKKLLAASSAYWKAFQESRGSAAVVWLTADDGSLVVVTRGEYREQIMENIEPIVREHRLPVAAPAPAATPPRCPEHDCEFESNPEKGACDFHDQWADSLAAPSQPSEPPDYDECVRRGESFAGTTAQPSEPTAETLAGLSVICRECGYLISGEEAGDRARFVTCRQCSTASTCLAAVTAERDALLDSIRRHSSVVFNLDAALLSAKTTPTTEPTRPGGSRTLL